MSAAALAVPADTATPRAYLQAVYRDPAVARWPASLVAARYGNLSWLYHGASRQLSLGCGHDIAKPRAGLCRDGADEQQGLVFCPPIKVRSISWFGYWRPPPGICAASPVAPRFHDDHRWIEVLRVATLTVSGSPAAVRRFGEGGGHGCWFIATRGTGVFINTGLSVRARSRAELVGRLGVNLTELAAARRRPLWVWGLLARRSGLTAKSRQNGLTAAEMISPRSRRA